MTRFCFFFQAEDGIRDRDVTGVQTCALPIWKTWSFRNPIGLVGFLYVQVLRALSLYVYILFIYFGGAAVFHIEIGRAACRGGVCRLAGVESALGLELCAAEAGIRAASAGARG